MRVCGICGEALKSRRQKYCSDECRAKVKYERNRAWLAANPGKAAGYSRKWREANPEEYKAVSAYAYRKKKLEKEGSKQ